MTNPNITEQQRNLLVATEQEIKSNQEMLAIVEPGWWMRMITGSLFWLMELVLWLTIILLIITAWVVDLNNSEDVRTIISSSPDMIKLVAEINLLIKIFLGGIAFAIFLLASLLGSSRRNLFKLAKVSDYLEKTLDNRKKQRDVVVRGMVEEVKG
jgi:hypothetical protein